jgi:hypothetical protein
MPPPAATASPPAFVPGRVRWWQWLTVLSLDAPLVAVAWQSAFTRVADAGAPPAPHHPHLRGAAGRLAYAADRWIEGWRLTPQTVRTQRHYFFLRWRWPAFAAWLAVLGGALALACRALTPREWIFSLALLPPVLAYLLSHQFLHRSHPWRVPKELCVAAILTLGAALYPAANLHGSLLPLAGPAALFFLLALANCLLISDWEREVDRQHGQTSLALRFAAARRLAAVLPWGLLVLAAAHALTHADSARTVALCAAASALLLGLLARAEPRLGRERARVLADVALLTPLLMWLPI